MNIGNMYSEHEMESTTVQMSRNSSISNRGRDSVVGMATRYELDGPGIESRLGVKFSAPVQTSPGPTQPPVQWVPGHSRG